MMQEKSQMNWCNKLQIIMKMMNWNGKKARSGEKRIHFSVRHAYFRSIRSSLDLWREKNNNNYIMANALAIPTEFQTDRLKPSSFFLFLCRGKKCRMPMLIKGFVYTQQCTPKNVIPTRQTDTRTDCLIRFVARKTQKRKHIICISSLNVWCAKRRR